MKTSSLISARAFGTLVAFLYALLIANQGLALKKPLEVQTLNALDVETSVNLNSTIVYIEDEDDVYSFEDIYRNRFTEPLQQQSGSNFNIGISDSTYWFFFKLNHFSAASDKPLERLIEIPYPPLDNIDFYILNLQTNELRHYQSGDNHYFHDRPLVNNNHLFPVLLEHDQEAFVAIRVNSKGSLRIPIRIWNPKAFYAANQSYLVFMGVYFGIMCLMFFYNGAIYFATKDKSYLHYIFYIGSLGLFQGLMTGFAGEYLWPNTPILNDRLLNPCILAICCSGAMFVRTLLDIKRHSPQIEKYLSIAIKINLFLIPIAIFLPYVATLKYSIAMGILTSSFCLFMGIKYSLAGIRTAHFFVLAWFCLLIAALIMGGVAIGLIPANVVTTNALLVGSGIEATLLSLTLADRMHLIQVERTAAENKAKLALEEANHALQESNKTKDEFLATISHELRTPMNGVLSCITHLQEENDPLKQKNFLCLAEQSANHMMLLVDGVLSYAELQAKRFVLNKELFSTQGLMNHLTETYQRLCDEKGIELRTEIKPDVPNYLFGDAAKINQLISNLADNAVKFTDQGHVAITFDIDAINKKQQTVELVFIVEDTGIGIPEGTEDLIFSKFRQLDGSNTRSHGGLGIGLTICQEIANQMGAEIKYKSALGKGTRFTFGVTLNYSMQPSESKEESAKSRYPLEELTRNKRALIAEDNPINAMILKALLEKVGLATDVAANGVKAMELVNDNTYDIILMDCQMPEMDGLEATQKIRELGGDKALIPIVAVTANATSADRNRCIKAGMNDYLSKPLNRQELLEKLTQWLPIETKNETSETNSNVTPISPRFS